MSEIKYIQCHLTFDVSVWDLAGLLKKDIPEIIEIWNDGKLDDLVCEKFSVLEFIQQLGDEIYFDIYGGIRFGSGIKE